jgi:hypothetical protein
MAKKENAYQKLENLKMKDKLLDDYITSFNSLAVKAEWELGNKGTINAFQTRLCPGTLNAIMNRDVWPKTITEWQEATRRELYKYLTKKAILAHHPTQGNQENLGTRNHWQHCFGQCGQGGGSFSHDPNAMDIDAINTRNLLSEEEKRCLMAEGCCFFCKQQGHVSQGCPKKPNRPFNVPVNPQPTRNAPPPPHIRTTRADDEEMIITAPKQKESIDLVINSIGGFDKEEK